MKRNRKKLREEVAILIRSIDPSHQDAQDAIKTLHDVLDTLSEPEERCRHKFETIQVMINKTRLVGDVCRCEKCGLVRRTHEKKSG